MNEASRFAGPAARAMRSGNDGHCAAFMLPYSPFWQPLSTHDMRLLAFSIVILTMTIGGCAGPMVATRPAEAVSSAMAAPVTEFDGSYRSTIRSTGAFGAAKTTAWCDSPGQPIITVTNGQFTYAVPHPSVPGNATPVFPATVAADGSISGQIIAGTVSGQIHGSHMEGRIDGSACNYAFAGDRM